MLINSFSADKLHQLYRPQSPDRLYLTLKEFDAKLLFGAGGQNPINCGSSMLKDTPKLKISLKEFVEKHFKDANYLRSLIKDDEQLAKICAHHLQEFKQSLTKRIFILTNILVNFPFYKNNLFEYQNEAIDIEFKDNIYEGYLFIVIALYFTFNYTHFSPKSQTREIIEKYFNHSQLITQIKQVLETADNIENLTSFCHGRYFFVDDKLSDTKDFKEFPLSLVTFLPNNLIMKPFNKVYFGCPGTGKSFTINKLIQNCFFHKITFHPNYDYHNFIGVYKPVMIGDKISYKFTPQVFIDIYVRAWKYLNEHHYLVIEELNRGNCAAIFGDIFQLLDRDNLGFSQYPIKVDADLQYFLKEEFKDTDYSVKLNDFFFTKNKRRVGNVFEWLCLPPNLSILATMNTSDQSLFPMDSAFKRRWEWEYVPIDYEAADKIGIEEFGTGSWGKFLRAINTKIKAISNSEDKQMGTYFVVATDNIISFATFKNKVMAYLWFDILKHESPTDEYYFFKFMDGEKINNFTFEELFTSNGDKILKQFYNFVTKDN